MNGKALTFKEKMMKEKMMKKRIIQIVNSLIYQDGGRLRVITLLLRVLVLSGNLRIKRDGNIGLMDFSAFGLLHVTLMQTERFIYSLGLLIILKIFMEL